MKNESYRVLIVRLAPQDLDLGIGVLYRLGITYLEQKRNQESLWIIARLPFEAPHKEIMDSLFQFRTVDTGRRIFNRLRCQTVLKGRWAREFQKYLKPFPLISETSSEPALWLDPSGKSPKKTRRETLFIEPGLAFGTGHHPSTRMAAELLGDVLKERKGLNILDMGCGTAILAMVARKRGASQVLAVDLDPIALEVAKKNIRLNQISHIVLKESLRGIRRKFDGIVANILFDTLLRLQGDFKRHLKDGGFLIVSGLLYRDCEALIEAYEGFKLMERKNTKGWSALLFKNN